MTKTSVKTINDYHVKLKVEPLKKFNFGLIKTLA